MQIDATATTFRLAVGLHEQPFRRINAIALWIAVLAGCAVALIDALPAVLFAFPALAALLGLAGLWGAAKRNVWELVVDQHSLRCGLVGTAQFSVSRDQVQTIQLHTNDDVHTHAVIPIAGRRIALPIVIAVQDKDETIARAIANLWPEVLVTYRDAPICASATAGAP